jgi:hypothetical protein
MGDDPALSHCSFLKEKNLDQNRPVYWDMAVKETPTVGSPFIGAFLSDYIPNATKKVNVQFFNHSSNSCILYQRFLGTF